MRPRLTRVRIADELRRRIEHGQLPPGAPVRQEAVAAEFGTSQGPAREAFRTLAGEGLLIHRTNRGYRVVEIDSADVGEVRIVRELLETEAYGLVIPGLTDADIEDLDSHAAALRAAAALPASTAPDVVVEQIVSAHIALHDALLARLTAPRLRMLTSTFQRHALRMRRATLGADLVTWRTTVAADLELLAACAERDAGAALAVLAADRAAAADAVTGALAAGRLEGAVLATGAQHDRSDDQMGDRHG